MNQVAHMPHELQRLGTHCVDCGQHIPQAIDVPRHVWDAVNTAIHTSKIDGCVQPISLCYVAVRAALAAYEAGEPHAEEARLIWLKKQLAKPNNGLSPEVPA